MKTLLAFLLLATSALAAQPSGVVNVVVDHGMSWGSGILVTKDTILTAYHVIEDIEDVKEVFVHFPTIKTSYRVKAITKFDHTWDLALLTLDGEPEGVEPFIFAAEPPQLGDTLTVSGFGPDFSYEEDPGILDRFVGPGYGYSDSWLIIADCTARPGDSGGPIVNATGHLVGCLWGTDASAEETVGCDLEKILEFCR